MLLTTSAIDVLALDHTPPVVVLLKVVVELGHIGLVPLSVPGRLLTDTLYKARQPVAGYV